MYQKATNWQNKKKHASFKASLLRISSPFTRSLTGLEPLACIADKTWYTWRKKKPYNAVSYFRALPSSAWGWRQHQRQRGRQPLPWRLPPPSPLELVHETCLTRSAQVALVCVALLGHHRAPSKQFLEAAEAVTPQLCSWALGGSRRAQSFWKQKLAQSTPTSRISSFLTGWDFWLRISFLLH